MLWLYFVFMDFQRNRFSSFSIKKSIIVFLLLEEAFIHNSYLGLFKSRFLFSLKRFKISFIHRAYFEIDLN